MHTPSIRLDKSRPHETVHGEVSHGLAFRQDGLPFNQMGELIVPLVNTDELKAVAERKMRRLQKAAQRQRQDDPATSERPRASSPELATILDRLAALEQENKALRAKVEGTPVEEPPASSTQPPAPPTGQEDADDDGEDGGGNAAGREGEDYNFEAWLRDEVRYIPGKLFKEARNRFGRQFNNFFDLAEFLVHDQKLMKPEDVPTKLNREG